MLLGMKKIKFNFKMILDYCCPKLNFWNESWNGNVLIKLGIKNDE